MAGGCKEEKRKIWRRLEMNDPEKRKIENFDEFGIDRSECDFEELEEDFNEL